MLRWALALSRTPRELLAQVTNADIVEMMAFESLEPFGSLADDLRAGQVCAAVFNVHRTQESDRVFTPSDFMPALAEARNASKPGELVFLEDPEQMTALIKRQVFGVSDGPKDGGANG